MMMMMKKNNQFNFQEENSFEKRKQESEKILKKYTDRLPIIVEVFDTTLPPLDKSKYLVPNDLTFGQFLFVIRKRLKLSSSEIALFSYTENGTLPVLSQLVGEVYNENKNKDGFLYIHIAGEKTFGSYE